MTGQDKNDIVILSLFKDTSLVYDEAIKEALKDIFGDSSFTMLHDLKTRNHLEGDMFYQSGGGGGRYGWKITTVGKRHLEHLLNEQRNKKIRTVCFWVLFVASIISAFYAVISYHFSGKSKNESASKADTAQAHPKIAPAPLMPLDTTKVVKIVSGDTFLQKLKLLANPKTQK